MECIGVDVPKDLAGKVSRSGQLHVSRRIVLVAMQYSFHLMFAVLALLFLLANFHDHDNLFIQIFKALRRAAFALNGVAKLGEGKFFVSK